MFTTMIDQEYYAAAVASGARYFDQNFPGWEQKFDPDQFDMNSYNCCIAATVSGMDYREFCIKYLGGNEYDVMDRSISYGFIPPYPNHITSYCNQEETFVEYLDESMAALERAWESLIKERFNLGILSSASY